MGIHQTAVIAPGAEIGKNVSIGPFCVIENNTRIGEGCQLKSHVCLREGTSLGRECVIEAQAVLGGDPQDLKYGGEESFVRIGDRNIIREYVTVHRATGEGEATVLGDDNMIMAYSHVGHNARLGSHIMLSSYVGISGHVVIEDRVVIGGLTGIHQFVTIGKQAMIGGYSSVMQDVPPYFTADGTPSRPRGVNVIGLRRAEIDSPRRTLVKRAFKLLYRSGLNVGQAMDEIESNFERTPEIEYLLDFLKRTRAGAKGRQQQHG